MRYKDLIIEQIGIIKNFRETDADKYVTSLETLIILLPSQLRTKLRDMLPERTNSVGICLSSVDAVFEKTLDEIREHLGVGY